MVLDRVRGVDRAVLAQAEAVTGGGAGDFELSLPGGGRVPDLNE
jgi:hypothetical protein